jgi:tetratricopeptide (TPR) repeat protein
MDDELLHYNLGVAHYKMGQMPDAIKSWEKILPKIGEEPNLCFNLANAYALSGRLRRALHFYQRAIDGYKSMVHKAMRTENEEKEKYAYSLLAKAYNNLATVFEKEKHWQKASNLYAKALQCSSIAGELSPLSYKNINRLCLKAKGKPHFYKDVMKKMRG